MRYLDMSGESLFRVINHKDLDKLNLTIQNIRVTDEFLKDAGVSDQSTVRVMETGDIYLSKGGDWIVVGGLLGDFEDHILEITGQELRFSWPQSVPADARGHTAPTGDPQPQRRQSSSAQRQHAQRFARDWWAASPDRKRAICDLCNDDVERDQGCLVKSPLGGTGLICNDCFDDELHSPCGYTK